MASNLPQIAAAALAVALLVSIPAFGSSESAANKAAVAAGSVELLSVPLSSKSASENVTLLTTEVKTSRTMDLLFQVSLECALWTSVTTTGNFDSSSRASVTVWVEVDGKPVTLGSADPNAGRVIFCDRMHRQVTSMFDDDDARIQQFLNTRTANSFDWVAIDVGSDTHVIEVKARLESTVTGSGTAQAGIGQRTVVIEPIHLASGYSF